MITIEQRLRSDVLRRAWIQVLETPSEEADDRLLEALDAVLADSPATTEQVTEAFERGMNDPNPMKVAVHQMMLESFLQGALDIVGGHPVEGFIWGPTTSTNERLEQEKS